MPSFEHIGEPQYRAPVSRAYLANRIRAWRSARSASGLRMYQIAPGDQVPGEYFVVYLLGDAPVIRIVT
jgi:hypothetical protein